jgi:hypothetical protein
LKALTARSVAALTEYLQGLDIVLGDNATITEIAREPDQWEICGASSSVLHEVRLLIDPKPELTTTGGKALEPDYFATWTMALRQGRGDLLKQAFQKIEITLPEVFSVREKQFEARSLANSRPNRSGHDGMDPGVRSRTRGDLCANGGHTRACGIYPQPADTREKGVH